MEQVVARAIKAWKLPQTVKRVALLMLNSAKVPRRGGITTVQLEDVTSSRLPKTHSQVCGTSFIAALHATEIRTEPRSTFEAMPSCTILMASHAEHRSAMAKATQHATMEWTFNEEATFSLG
jgi:hypothetical protein